MALPGVNPTYRYLDDGSPDGTILGQTITSLVGFFGTVTSQPTATQQAAVTTSGAVSISATQFGFATAAQADGVVRLVNQLRSDAVRLGLIKGS